MVVYKNFGGDGENRMFACLKPLKKYKLNIKNEFVKNYSILDAHLELNQKSRTF